MDEEFFFPQNVQTTYRLLGMGPRHLRRAVLGLPVALLIAVLIAQANILWGVLIGTILAAAYLAGCCWPTNGDETVLDLWLHIQRMQHEQTRFIREEVTYAGATAADAARAVLWDLPGARADHLGTGVADMPAPQKRA